MKDKILEIIKQWPKHFSQKIKRDAILYQWVLDHSTESDIIAERIYLAVTNDTSICPRGNKKKFKSFNDGYGFCGKASVCPCTRESVSKKVSATKQFVSKSEQDKINDKRKKTSLKLYGVSNNGQTLVAKQKHKDFYKSQDNINGALEKYKDTILKRYGVTNIRDIPEINDKIQRTILSRYGVTNISHIPGVTEKAQNTKSEKYSSYSELMLTAAYLRFVENCLIDSDVTVSTTLNEYNGTNNRYDFLCNKCEYSFSQRIDGGLTRPQCRRCNPVVGSKEQQEVVDFIISLGISNIEVNDRIQLSGKEIDIYLPDYKIGIEYNGVYWHSDSRVGKKYHYDKNKQCNDVGIELISIFSSQWKHKKQIVKNMLSHKLLKAPQCTVYARKCKIVELSQSDANVFLDNNHILGTASAKYRYALQYEEKIVAIMTFSHPRLGIGNNQTGIELVRYATSCVVPGGASRLLSYCVKKLSPKSIYSFSDNTVSSGKLYSVLGFTKENEYGPGYWYVDPKTEQMYHRFNFRKSNLEKLGFDKEIFTERESMELLGYYRIWDCGKIKWIKEFF